MKLTWLIYIAKTRVWQYLGILLYILHCVKSVCIRSYSGPHFPVFQLNLERYGLSLSIQFECREMQTRIAPNMGTFYTVLVSSYILKMLVKIFENNDKNITENIVKLKMEWNIKSLLYFYLACLSAWETDFWQVYDKPDKYYWEPNLKQTVKCHNWWVTLTYCDYNPFLVITRFIHEKRLGVRDHKITKTMQFAKTMYGVKFRKR